jgi:hypothetical protein
MWPDEIGFLDFSRQLFARNTRVQTLRSKCNESGHCILSKLHSIDVPANARDAPVECDREEEVRHHSQIIRCNALQGLPVQLKVTSPLVACGVSF